MSDDIQLTSKLPLEEVKKTPEYARLTPKQRLWCATYIESGMALGEYDGILATRTAFACRNQENARIMSYSVLENIHIIEVLNIHFRLDPIAAFSKIIDRAIANKKITMAQVQALKIKCDLLQRQNKLPVSTGPTDGSPVLNQASENATILSRRPGRPRIHPKKPTAKNQIEDAGKNPFDNIFSKKPAE